MQIQIDQDTYEALRRASFERRQSVSATVRDVLRQTFSRGATRKKRLKDFKLVGALKSGAPNRTSEDHDRILGEGRW